MSKSQPSRRRFLAGSAAAAGTVLGMAPYVKTARSAGSLAIGLWDHWVPGANAAMEKICTDWGAANGVEVSVDFITSIGNKLLLTAQAESRAEAGHDIYCIPGWMPSIFQSKLEPVDDVIADIEAAHGEMVPSVHYMARPNGTYRAVPAPTGSLLFAMVSRLDLYRDHAGVDLAAIFPNGPDRDPALVDGWTYDAWLAAAEKLQAAGKPFGAPIAPTPDGTQWIAMTFAAFGAVMADAKGEIRVDSDQTRQALDYLARMVGFMDRGVYAWDDAGNNRWMISGSGSSIFNPPSAWAVAKRDNPDVAQHIWHHDTPRGPAGRFRPSAPFFWGVWQFSENISAAKDLFRHVAQRDVVDQMLRASQGFDLPLIKAYYQGGAWDTASPPDGVLYNYPIRGDEIENIAGFPAPPEVASLIFTQGLYPNMLARFTQGGDTMDDVISWAESEIMGYMRG